MALVQADVYPGLREEVSQPRKGTEGERLVASPRHSFPLSDDAQEKVQRLALRLRPAVDVPGPCTLIFGEIGFSSRSSALWLTAAVAESLTSQLDQPVHVIAVEYSRVGSGSDSSEDARPDVAAGGAIELFSLDSKPGMVLATTLHRRVKELQASGRKILLHLPDVQGWINSMSGLRPEGLVLLARAGHTRKAALAAIQLRVDQLELPLLGAVLLERTYPIPESLYRLL